jgi:hypothetical protein
MDISTIIVAISAFISALATVVLVGVTAYYAFINKKILKSNEKISNDNLRPYVIAIIFSEDYLLKLQIKNIGKKPAVKIDISFNPSLNEIDKIFLANGERFVTHEPMLKQEYLPPDFEVTTVLLDTQHFVNDGNLQREFKTTLDYYDLENKNYIETYTINLGSLVYKKKAVDYTDNYYFKQIKINLQEMNESLKSIASIIKVRE